MTSIFRKYSKDCSGNIAVLTALLGVPVMIAASVAIDTQKLHSEVGNLQSALDTATLAAVTKGKLSEADRLSHAKTVFRENYSGDLKISLNGKATQNRVKLSANGKMQTTLAGILGVKDVDMRRESTAEVTQESVTCLLVLAKNAKRALTFGGDAQFFSPDCAIQVNSTHGLGLWGGSNRPPVAQDICVTGGYFGRFGTHVKTECRPVEDPYKDVTVPDPGPCTTVPGIALEKSTLAGSTKLLSYNVSNETQDYTVLSPGNYCGGIKLNGDVKLRPGVYHITDGPLVLSSNSRVVGDDITFILHGAKANLYMQDDAKADITATHEGDLGGIAFFQVPSNAKWPETISLVQSGGDLTVNGLFYFPTGDLIVQGTAKVGAKAKATSFIAHTLKIEAEVVTTIQVDHRAAGLPPLKPRTDESARLVPSEM